MVSVAYSIDWGNNNTTRSQTSRAMLQIEHSCRRQDNGATFSSLTYFWVSFVAVASYGRPLYDLAARKTFRSDRRLYRPPRPGAPFTSNSWAKVRSAPSATASGRDLGTTDAEDVQLLVDGEFTEGEVRLAPHESRSLEVSGRIAGVAAGRPMVIVVSQSITADGVDSPLRGELGVLFVAPDR